MSDLDSGSGGLTRLIQFRWIASLGTFGVLLVSAARLPLDLRPAFAVAALIPLSNVAHIAILRRKGPSRAALFAQFGVDLALLTVLLGILGGVDGPSIALYLLHVLLALLLLERRDALAVGGVALGLAAALAGLQVLGAPFPLRTGHLYSALLEIHPPLGASGGFVFGQLAMLALISTVLAFLVVPVVEQWRVQREQLRLSEAEARSRMKSLDRILHSTGAMVLVIDRSHRLEWANDTVLKRFPRLAVGQERRCYDPAEPMGGGEAPPCPSCRVLETGEPWEGDYTMAVPAGRPLVMRVYATPLVGPSGTEHVVELVLDVTEERRNQQELLDARKTAALTTLAAGVAHEMNTPLASLAAGLRTVQRTAQVCAKAGTQCHRLLGDLVEQTERCQRIMQSMLTYAQEFRSRLVATEVDGVIRKSIEDLGVRRDIAGIEIAFVGARSNIPPVLCNPDHLQMVVLNVLANAIDSLRESARTRPRVHIAVRSLPGDSMVELRIRDNGKGMLPEVVRHVFEPFFTTKPAGAGTGLGLAVSEGVLTGMGGTIAVDSAPGRGTDVVVRLRTAGVDSPLLQPFASVAGVSSAGKRDA